ncbi:MAG: dihydrolipoyl dehydrogenase [Chitinivibrionales bacterium]|nr:dihydrolipoyl dehydrogenase [Chitinivibrionales bacterium]
MAQQSKQASVAVIGAGPGGYAAAFLAADLGMDVALIDPEANPGGVCLYRGCIPTKALLHACSVKREMERAREWGLSTEKRDIDIDKLRSWKDAVVKKLTSGLGQISAKRSIRYIRGRASFKDAQHLAIQTANGKNEALAFENAIIATGAYPASLKGLSFDSPRIMDSASALNIADIPERLLVIGGGYIGLEMGTIYATLGSKVTIVEMMDQLLPGTDADLVKTYLKAAKDVYESVHTGTIAEVKESKKGLDVTLKTGEESQKASFDKVLLTVGRKPATNGLDLENTGVSTNDKGFIEVDTQQRTHEANIFAIGDVCSAPLLAHKAAHEGRTAAEVIAGKAAAFAPHAIPAVEYTDPEIAQCGMRPDEAEAQGLETETSSFPWAASGRALTLGRPEGLTKLTVEKGTGRVLGAGIVGAGAGELIAEVVLAVEMGATVADLAMTIHPHPTLSETIMQAAEMFEGTATDIFKPG